MNFHVNSKSGTPIYEQLEGQIRNSIVEKKMLPGEALPSIRGLAADLRISVITTKRAYVELEKEGLIYSVPGKGFFVDNTDAAFMEEKRMLNLEAEIQKLISGAKAYGVSKKEFLEMSDILWGDEND